MVLGGLVLAVMAAFSGELGTFDPAVVTRDSLVAFAYLTVIGSILAFTVYGWMLRAAPLPLVATYAYVNPVVAVILGWLVLGEAIDPRTVLAGGVIIFAVALIVTARGRMQRPTTAAQGASPGVATVPTGKPATTP
jgi:drug/metabolite transporter (DMT)-like permease